MRGLHDNHLHYIGFVLTSKPAAVQVYHTMDISSTLPHLPSHTTHTQTLFYSLCWIWKWDKRVYEESCCSWWWKCQYGRRIRDLFHMESNRGMLKEWWVEDHSFKSDSNNMILPWEICGVSQCKVNLNLSIVPKLIVSASVSNFSFQQLLQRTCYSWFHQSNNMHSTRFRPRRKNWTSSNKKLPNKKN